VLPSLHARKGRAPAYTLGDVVALTVLHSLTTDWGIQIGSLKEVSTEIFLLCNSTPWMSLECRKLLIDVVNKKCLLESTAAKDKYGQPVLNFPLRPAIERLRNEFLHTGSTATQRELSLPATSIARTRIDRRSAKCEQSF
jgi:hypothetical protein